MASAVTETAPTVVPIVEDKITLTGLAREPIKSNGSLDSFESFDVTPIIGREFPNANLKDFLPNSGREHSVKDDEISVISSASREKLYKDRNPRKQTARREWHSDITFEPIPSDYTLLRLTELPKTGGDTLWASGYEIYDRISEPYQKFLESLTATYAQPGFNEVAKRNDFTIHPGPRGAPENVGEELIAEHPVIRTNPVTGWKSVFAVGTHVQKVNGVSEEESRHLLDWFVTLIVENHDLQVRKRWENPNDLAIWDNRSVYHAATWDYDGLGPRTGHRAVGLGERPYLDPKSIGRREALEKSE
ncbi:Taurine catabolism dioxygenase TauD/TfdA [Penicillium camemberti]|uniref:Taurine catabolism dioxygenase TauD/TfdA n=1 Tax=Penicillium camemberti (strain FM 013) TaxID=1429867 RepID=A0A0G4PHX1_PENC3|nr:Taurine catabolism dioxygenase TauD/TfdA [Penicillium camemberti]